MSMGTREKETSLEVARIAPGDGWCGLVRLSGPSGGKFTEKDWIDCLGKVEELTVGAEREIKSDGKSRVVVKRLLAGSKDIKVVIKTEISSGGVKGFFRSMQRAKSVRNFRRAAVLFRKNIPVVMPLAALEYKRLGLVRRSVLISEYIDGSDDLLTYLRTDEADKLLSDVRAKRSLCCQAAEIFAGLERASFYHRDAKASNYLIGPSVNDGMLLSLLDMDGIKCCGFRGDGDGYEGFCKLASTLLWQRRIHTTDYMRTFKKYCQARGAHWQNERAVFKRLCEKSIAMRLLSFSRSAIDRRRI